MLSGDVCVWAKLILNVSGKERQIRYNSQRNLTFVWNLWTGKDLKENSFSKFPIVLVLINFFLFLSSSWIFPCCWRLGFVVWSVEPNTWKPFTLLLFSGLKIAKAFSVFSNIFAFSTLFLFLNLNRYLASIVSFYVRTLNSKTSIY